MSLQPISWLPPAIVPGETVIRGSHITQIRDAIDYLISHAHDKNDPVASAISASVALYANSAGHANIADYATNAGHALLADALVGGGEAPTGSLAQIVTGRATVAVGGERYSFPYNSALFPFYGAWPSGVAGNYMDAYNGRGYPAIDATVELGFSPSRVEIQTVEYNGKTYNVDGIIDTTGSYYGRDFTNPYLDALTDSGFTMKFASNAYGVVGLGALPVGSDTLPLPRVAPSLGNPLRTECNTMLGALPYEMNSSTGGLGGASGFMSIYNLMSPGGQAYTRELLRDMYGAYLYIGDGASTGVLYLHTATPAMPHAPDSVPQITISYTAYKNG